MSPSGPKPPVVMSAPAKRGTASQASAVRKVAVLGGGGGHHFTYGSRACQQGQECHLGRESCQILSFVSIDYDYTRVPGK